MLTYALIVFAVAALGGLVLASSVLRGKLAPWALSILHALLGATGLVLLLLGVMGGSGAGRAVAALGLLVVAALGGFYLASIHARKAVAPKYANPADTSQTWTGRGRKPQWVQAALDAGKSLEDLAI